VDGKLNSDRGRDVIDMNNTDHVAQWEIFTVTCRLGGSDTGRRRAIVRYEALFARA
jgi:hypothetical protein